MSDIKPTFGQTLDGHAPQPFSEKEVNRIVWTLLAFFPIIGMVIDLVAPSLPGIALSLHVSNSLAKMVISIYLLAYALGNFFTGFLADAYGRQKLLRFNLLAFVVVSALPILFPNIEMLLISRALQGLTIGAVSVLSRAIFADLLPPEKLVRLGTLIGTMWGLGPVIGPVIGGYLQAYLGWKAGFGFFTFLGALSAVVTFWVVPETHFNRQCLCLRTIGRNLKEVLSHRLFMGTVIVMGLAYSLLIAFNTAGPFLIQERLHYSPIFFGHLALILGIVFLASTFVCRAFLKHWTVATLLPKTILASMLFAFLAIPVSYFFSNNVVLIGFVTAVMYFSCGLVFPMSMGRGIGLFRHIAGTATAVMYLINILITSATAFALGFFKMDSAISLMWVFGILLCLLSTVYWALCRLSFTQLGA